MPRTNNPQPAYGRAAPAGPQKPVHKRATLTRLCRYLMRFRWWILLALALTLASNLLALLAPMLSGKAIDSMEGGPGGVDFPRWAGMPSGCWCSTPLLRPWPICSLSS